MTVDEDPQRCAGCEAPARPGSAWCSVPCNSRAKYARRKATGTAPLQATVRPSACLFCERRFDGDATRAPRLWCNDRCRWAAARRRARGPEKIQSVAAADPHSRARSLPSNLEARESVA